MSKNSFQFWNRKRKFQKKFPIVFLLIFCVVKFSNCDMKLVWFLLQERRYRQTCEYFGVEDAVLEVRQIKIRQKATPIISLSAMVPPLSSNFPCKIYIILLLIFRNFLFIFLLPIYRLPKGGKRPIVELVLRTPEGRYQPIKFRNNSQITENIPRTLFHKVCFRKQPVRMCHNKIPSLLLPHNLF